MLDLHRLKVFLAVYEQRSFSGASRKLHLTQPTVSAHIKDLEEWVGAPLFDRLGREVAPTRVAEVLLPYARRILHLFGETGEAIASFIGGEKGSLRLGGSSIPSQYILPRLIGAFKATRPQIRVALQVGDSRGVLDLVRSGAIEMGMVGAVFRGQDLVFEPCCEDVIVLAVSAGHRLSSARTVSYDEIRSEPMVAREPGSGTYRVVENALRAVGARGFDGMNVVIEMGSTEAVRQSVKAGLGIGFVSLVAVEEDIARGNLAALSLEGVDLSRQFYFVARRDRTRSPLAARFHEFAMANLSVFIKRADPPPR